MTKRELEAMVSGVKSPPLDRKQTRKLFEENGNVDSKRYISNEVAQEVAHHYTQPVAQEVVHHYKQPVAQEVAQAPWVAQESPKKVAQSHKNKVAQNRPQQVAQPKPKEVAQNRPQGVGQFKMTPDKERVRIEVERLKQQISQILGVEERKHFVRDIGWTISGERRGKKYYLFGIKKLCGDKYKLYIGNATG